MAITSILKRSLTREIIKIEEKADYITKLKDEAIAVLLTEKDNISQQSRIDRQKDYVEKDHGEFMKVFDEMRGDIQSKKRSFDELQTETLEIEKQLELLEERHNIALQQLEEKRAFLEERLSAINRLDWKIEALQQALLDNEADYKAEMDSLKKKRAELLAETDLAPEETAKLLEQLDSQMEDADKLHAGASEKLSDKITELQSSATLNEELLKAQIADLKNRIAELEARKLHASPSELLEIERQLKELRDELEQLEHLAGLTHMAQQELAGLIKTPSGHYMTPSGHKIDLSPSQLARLAEESGVAMSPSECDKMGLSKFMGGSDKSETVSTVTASSRSGLSSADTHYLKTVLGIPLTLALAEITAKQPRDPIHYLGHWLFKFRYNQEIDEVKKRDLQQLLDERERLRLMMLRQQADEEAKVALMDLLGRVNVEFERRAIEAELKRIQEEAAALEAANEQLEMEAQDTLGEYTGPTKGQKL